MQNIFWQYFYCEVPPALKSLYPPLLWALKWNWTSEQHDALTTADWIYERSQNNQLAIGYFYSLTHIRQI